MPVRITKLVVNPEFCALRPTMARDKGKPQGPARMPTVYPKQRPQIQELAGRDVFTLSGVVSEKEARGIIDFALSLGLQHQSSRGPKYGEVGTEAGAETGAHTEHAQVTNYCGRICIAVLCVGYCIVLGGTHGGNGTLFWHVDSPWRY